MADRKLSKLAQTTADRAPTMEACAGREGIPLEVLKRSKRDGCQAFLGNGTVDVPALLGWLAERPGYIDETMSRPNPAFERALDIRASRMMREHKLALAKRDVIPVSEVRHKTVRMIVSARSKILASLKTGVSVGGAKCGLRPEQADAVLAEIESRVRDAMTELSRGEWSSVACECGRSVE